LSVPVSVCDATMMQALRPVRAKASKLLSAPIGTNSKVDYQQAFGEAPASYEVSACHMPVMWPMHSEVSGANCSQNQMPMSPEAAGGMMWIQPVFWPVFSTNDGMQNGVPWDAAQGGGIKGMPFHQEPQQAVGGTFGLRKQRRSRRNGCQTGTRIASDAAMCPDELEEMRRAVKSTKQALEARNTEQALEARSKDEWSVRLPTKPAHAEKHNPSPKTLKQFTSSTSKTGKPSWADAKDEDDEEQGETSSMASLDTAESLKVHRDADLQQATTWNEHCGNAPDPISLDRNISNGSSLSALSLAEESFSLEADNAMLELDNVDGANFRPTMDWVVSTAWPLALTRNGCRVVQQAIDVGSLKDQKAIVEKLHGRVLEAMLSPHANHVLQKCIEILPGESMSFVLTELQGNGAFAARHRFGCRILQRLIEHCPASQAEGIISEVMVDTATLCRHQYGNFVVQHILQHASSEHRSAVAEVLCEDTIRLAKHRVASHVLSCAMVHCAPADVHKLTQVVGSLRGLSRREYGSFVVREVNRAARLMQDANIQE